MAVVRVETFDEFHRASDGPGTARRDPVMSWMLCSGSRDRVRWVVNVAGEVISRTWLGPDGERVSAKYAAESARLERAADRLLGAIVPAAPRGPVHFGRLLP